jgi:glycosyltransferase involved in cell wall biosynthesis
MAVDSRARQTLSAEPNIVGIILVRNEDLRIERVIQNICGFCDRILVADHGSTDGTRATLERIVATPRKCTVELHRTNRSGESHDLLQQFVGTNTWVFGVDGDEIYDPVGLVRMKARLVSNEFAKSWMILSNVLNCSELDESSGRSKGYLAPPCRSITKLYNFNAIDSWQGSDIRERLHGGEITFRPGYHTELRRNLHEEMMWDDSDLRCLHLCFLPRSSKDSGQSGTRENIMEKYPRGIRGSLTRLFSRLMRQSDAVSAWKKSRYMRGALVEVDVSKFFGE